MNVRLMENALYTTNTIYKATVLLDKPGYKDKIYKGLAETTFKKRFANHKKSFRYEKYTSDIVEGQRI